MNNERNNHDDLEMAEVYDFSDAVQGFFADRIPPGSELKELTPAQAKKWLAARKKQREASNDVAQWLVGYIAADKSKDTSNELIALEKKLKELRSTIQQLARITGKHADKPVREANDISKEAQQLLKRLKNELLQHARELKTAS